MRGQEEEEEKYPQRRDDERHHHQHRRQMRWLKLESFLVSPYRQELVEHFSSSAVGISQMVRFFRCGSCRDSLASSSPNRKSLIFCRRNWKGHSKSLTPILCFCSVHLSCSLLISEIGKGHVILRVQRYATNFPTEKFVAKFRSGRVTHNRRSQNTRFSMNRIQRSVQSSAQTQQQRQPRRSFCNKNPHM